ncbi:hypothetical protein HDU77_011814 [Chytriomyces hyalinus]|nr:hypothetical protein HDU77_011814 [Chytriomyces hyalinus]
MSPPPPSSQGRIKPRQQESEKTLAQEPQEYYQSGAEKGGPANLPSFTFSLMQSIPAAPSSTAIDAGMSVEAIGSLAEPLPAVGQPASEFKAVKMSLPELETASRFPSAYQHTQSIDSSEDQAPQDEMTSNKITASPLSTPTLESAKPERSHQSPAGNQQPVRRYKYKPYDHDPRDFLPSFVPAELPQHRPPQKAHTAPKSGISRISSSSVPLFRLGEESHFEETADVLGVERTEDVTKFLRNEGISRWAAISAFGGGNLLGESPKIDEDDYVTVEHETKLDGNTPLVAHDGNSGSFKTGSIRSKPRKRKGTLKTQLKRNSLNSIRSKEDLDEVAKKDFILKLSRSLTMYGAPAHRLEHHLSQVSKVLETEADFIIFPGVIMISFGAFNHSQNTHFIRASQGINMGKLAQVNAICLTLTQKHINVHNALDLLEGVRAASDFPWWVGVYLFPVFSFTVALILFQLSWVESLAALFLGLFVGYLNLAAERYGSLNYLLEFLSSLVSAVVAKGIQGWLHQKGFCFNYIKVTLSAVAIYLPGLPLTLAIIDLSSRNMVSGTVRMFGSLFTAMLIGFGMTIGGALAFWNTEGINSGPQECPPTSQLWAFLFFIPMSMSLNLLFQASKFQWPIMVLAAALGYITSVFLGYVPQLQAEPTAITALSAMVIGLTSNVYARFTNDVAIAPILAGILLQVPGALSVKGTLGFFAGSSSNGSTSNIVDGMSFTFSMLAIGMSLALGLFVSTLLVWPIKGPKFKYWTV